jgi:NAD(P)H dehydrogenase (quinone)
VVCSGRNRPQDSNGQCPVQDATPEPLARMLLGFFHAARAQCFAEVSPALAELLGREPRSVTDQLADTNAA